MFLTFNSGSHLRQTKTNGEVKWFEHDDIDAFMYCVIHALFTTFDSNLNSWAKLKDIEIDLASIVAAAQHLATKRIYKESSLVYDPYKIYPKITEYRNKIGVAEYV